MKHQLTLKQLPAQCVLLCLGLAVMALGVAFSIKASLGTSPISSFPYVTSRISGLSVGTTTIIVNTFFVLIQIPILRNRYQWFQLLQFPAVIVFGLLIDAVCISILTSLLFLGGLEGIREGTVAAAVCVGLVTRQCQKPVKWVTKKLLPAG